MPEPQSLPAADNLDPSEQPGSLLDARNTPTLPPACPAEGETLPPQAAAADQQPLTSGAATPPGYEVLGKLGQGGMGVVYKARHLKLNRIVALKMVLHAEHANEEELLRFLAEAEAVAHLQHPNVVQLYDSGTHNGLPYFTLEFVSGGSLADKLRDQPLAAKEAATLVQQIARGVQHAHERGIIHRDLKPANVLLAPASGGREPPEGVLASGGSRPPLADWVPKVTDFGLARRVETGSGLTATGAVMGTPSYMAPEQAGGDTRKVGPLADVYALGAILYVCLTGRPPFRTATALDTLLQVLGEEPAAVRTLQPSVPRDLETICHKCLQKEPGKRYASAAAFATDLERFLGGEPIQARPVGTAERVVKWVRRRPAIAGLLATVALVAMVGAVLVTWNWRAAVQQQHLAEDAAERERIAREEVDRKAEELSKTAERERKAREEVAAKAEELSKTALAERKAKEDAKAKEERAEQNLYLNRVALAQ